MNSELTDCLSVAGVGAKRGTRKMNWSPENQRHQGFGKALGI